MIAIIFDTETTGLLLPSSAPLEKQPRIIELGALKVDANGVLDELNQLLDPEQTITAEITKITGITPDQRKALTAMVQKAVKSKAWAEAMERNGWTDAWLAGPAFDEFVEREFASLRATMVKAGMV